MSLPLHDDHLAGRRFVQDGEPALARLGRRHALHMYNVQQLPARRQADQARTRSVTQYHLPAPSRAPDQRYAPFKFIEIWARVDNVSNARYATAGALNWNAFADPISVQRFLAPSAPIGGWGGRRGAVLTRPRARVPGRRVTRARALRFTISRGAGPVPRRAGALIGVQPSGGLRHRHVAALAGTADLPESGAGGPIVMPANLTPEYRVVEAAFPKARDPAGRLEWLREMLRVMPKHKGTDHLQEEIKRHIKELSEELERPRRGGGRGGPLLVVPLEGAVQIALIGPPNAASPRSMRG